MIQSSVLQTSSEVWDYLLTQGGLETKYYDVDIIEQIRIHLNILPKRKMEDFRQVLATNQIETEVLINAFFKAIAPFAGMMSDLLALFEKSGVTRSSHNLKVKFDFNLKEEELEFDLEHFRSWQSQFIYTLRPVHSYHVDTDNLFQLYDDLRRFLNVTGWDWNTANQDVRLWVEEYDRGSIPKYIPTLSVAGDTKFDHAYSGLYEIWQHVWADTLHHGISGNHIVDPNSPDDGYLRALHILERDKWLRQFLLLMETLHSQFITADRQWQLHTTQFMSHLLDRIPKTIRNISILTQELFSFLNLPIWKKRYDLYAAWVSSQIMNAFDDSSMKYIHEDGTITFSFSRTHLATSCKYRSVLELWSEVRTSITKPKGKSRTKAIQPDYSLLTEVNEAERSTLLVVECKQYRKASSKNFADALDDYARGRPNARVLIVNYGKGSQNLLQKVDQGLRSRVKVIHEMRPGSLPALQEFQTYIRETVEQTCTVEAPQTDHVIEGKQSGKMPIVAGGLPLLLKVSLSWGKRPLDLDLHLKIVTAANTEISIDFRNRGSFSSEPWSLLIDDIQDGIGPEEIIVSQWIEGGAYYFSVRNFSGDPSITQSGATVNISLMGQPSIEVFCPDQGEGDIWDVFSYDTMKGQLRIHNRLQIN